MMALKHSSTSLFMLVLSTFTLLLSPLCLAQSSHQITFQAGQASSLPRSTVKLTSISRNIELGGATSKATTVYSLKPSSDGSEAVFVFALDGREAANLSWIEAYTGRTGNTKKPVTLERVGDVSNESGTQYYKAILPSSAASSGEDIALSVQTAFNHYTSPKPATLPQEAANQGMEWESDLLGGHIVNPSDDLPKDSIKVRVKCPTPRAAEDKVPAGWTASHTPGSAFIQFTNTDFISATSGEQIASIHYEQPEPVLSVRKLDRTIQVSHWGNHVAVEDEILLVNDGPKLKGHFSRLSHQALSYQRRGAAFVTPHTASSISYSLHPNIYSPYFIDEVGNVSTSRFRPSPSRPSNTASLKSKTGPNLGKSHLQLTPRYPLLGGWNYSFSMGYKQPLGDVLRFDKTKGEYKLAIPFLTELKNAAFDDVTVKFVLPEGAHDIKVALPFSVRSSSTNTTYSYLDTSGRPTVTLHNKACSEIHAQDVIVSYKFTSADLVQKPAAVAGLALVAFILLGLSRKVSWTIKA
ncbi:Ribophorin I [Cystobasidium minutum MCA 4210]|uniref:Ribophorin I n=1 Tax=Cystobasidium minutum MCA 4210 TaxID=1397322 RepID=UPI0034CDB385|eukprot:jgi/Rhomi1/160479/estExt_Genewise1Plus.C_4_t10392